MTPGEFIAKWQSSKLKESSAAQEHFIDLCRLLGETTPAEADPTGERYSFERGARKDTGGGGWADVWRQGCFAWEYKGKHANLDAACQRRSKSTPLAGVKMHHLMRFSPALAVVPVVHRRDPRCFV